jgi:hypothetical protein
MSDPSSATQKANAVEKMRYTCEQKTLTAVSEATTNLSRDLTKSQRVQSFLQSKLAKAEVTQTLTQTKPVHPIPKPKLHT